MKTIPSSRPAALAAATLLVFAPASHAQKKPAPKPKPAAQAAPKPAPKPGAGQTIVLGTTQLPGDFGKLGQTYTIGKPDGTPINFTLDRAEFTVSPFRAGRDSIVPTGEEKLLVLHYTVHNPLPQEQMFDWSSVRFTAVDAKDVNHENEQYVVREGTTDDSLVVHLKPAQKISVMTTLRVPAAGVVPKLIAQRGDGSAVIRYDLRGKVDKLPAVVADPADATGSTARPESPGQVGVYYPVGAWEMRLDSVAYASEKLGDGEPEEGTRFFVASVTLRNPLSAPARYDWGGFKPTLIDSDGEKYEFNQWMLKAKANAAADGELKPGEEVRLRFFWQVPAAAQARQVRLSNNEEEGRAFLIDVSGAK